MQEKITVGSVKIRIKTYREQQQESKTLQNKKTPHNQIVNPNTNSSVKTNMIITQTTTAIVIPISSTEDFP